ncbi:heat-inducible transcriptional repressor HrcA, partial [Rhizobium ruizarguesonis]
SANFLNAHMSGQTLPELRKQLGRLKDDVRHELDSLSRDLVERGIAVWAGSPDEGKPTQLIIRGRANLLEGLAGAEDLDQAVLLLEIVEQQAQPV